MTLLALSKNVTPSTSDAFGNKVSNYCKIDTLVVEKVTGGGFGNSLGHMDTKSFSLKLVVAKVVPDRSQGDCAQDAGRNSRRQSSFGRPKAFPPGHDAQSERGSDNLA